MPRPHCGEDEEIVRAACGPTQYDGQRISPSLFVAKSGRVSVSRLQFFTLDEHWKIFERRLVTPPQRLEMIVQINIRELKRLGKEYKDGNGPRPTTLTVEEAPEDWNEAHAEVMEPITRGLANVILSHVVRHKRDTSNQAEQGGAN